MTGNSRVRNCAWHVLYGLFSPSQFSSFLNFLFSVLCEYLEAGIYSASAYIIFSYFGTHACTTSWIRKI